MGKINKNQLGFGTVEIILVVVIIGLLGAVGWFVYDKNKTETTPASSTVTTPTTTPTTETTTPTDTTKYLVVKEWGVKIPLSSDVSGLYYEISTNKVGSFRTTGLDKLGTKGCKSNSIIVARGKANDIPPNETDSTESNFKDYYDGAVREDDSPNSTTTTRDIHLKIGNYYYVPPGYSGASCLTSQTNNAQEAKLDLAIAKAVSKMIAE